MWIRTEHRRVEAMPLLFRGCQSSCFLVFFNALHDLITLIVETPAVVRSWRSFLHCSTSTFTNLPLLCRAFSAPQCYVSSTGRVLSNGCIAVERCNASSPILRHTYVYQYCSMLDDMFIYPWCIHIHHIPTHRPTAAQHG